MHFYRLVSQFIAGFIRVVVCIDGGRIPHGGHGGSPCVMLANEVISVVPVVKLAAIARQVCWYLM